MRGEIDFEIREVIRLVVCTTICWKCAVDLCSEFSYHVVKCYYKYTIVTPWGKGSDWVH